MNAIDKDLKQRQEVWGYFKSGAPGIETDGPYVLDKRDVWYMRHSSEQHAGYAWQEKGKTFIPVDLCFICNTLSDIELLTECETCFAFVCIDCSCGCNEPGYKADALDFSPTALHGKGADPRNDKAWVERECKKIMSLAFDYGDGGKAFKEATERYGKSPEFDCLPPIAELNEVRKAFTNAIEHQAARYFEDMMAFGSAVIESDLVWDVRCVNCGKLYHIPQPEPGTIFAMDFTCDCGHPISLSFGEF